MSTQTMTTGSATANTYPPRQTPAADDESGRTASIASATDNSFDAIPATDSSPEAIKFLVAAFVLETVVWSVPNAYGIFYDYYVSHTALGQHPNARFLLSLTGTCQSGVMYCSSPLVGYLQRRYPQYFSQNLWMGAVLLSSSLIITSFANAAYQIVLLQGVLYAVGGTLLYWAAFGLLPEWFVRRRGLASGVCFAGTSVGGIFLPFLIILLLDHFGEATTLRALGVGAFLLIAPVLHLVKRRVPYTSSKSSTYRRPRLPTDGRAWWQDSVFWLFAAATVLQAPGWFMVTLYVPSFASNLGLPAIQGTSALAALNAAGTISRLGAGWLTDYFSPYVVAAISLTSSSLSVFLLWGLASTTFGALLAFSLVFGLATAGFTSLASGVIKDLSGEDASLASMLFGVIISLRGIGNIVTSPISSALLSQDAVDNVPVTKPDSVYATSFSSVVVFSGATLIAAGAMSLGASLVKQRRAKSE